MIKIGFICLQTGSVGDTIILSLCLCCCSKKLFQIDMDIEFLFNLLHLVSQCTAKRTARYDSFAIESQLGEIKTVFRMCGIGFDRDGT